MPGKKLIRLGEELVFFSFFYIKLFELGIEVALNNQSAVIHHQISLFKFPLRSSNSERTDYAFVLLIYFCFFHLSEPLVPVCRTFKFKNICDLQSLIDCDRDPIRSPAPETIYEERLWIEVVPLCIVLKNKHMEPGIGERGGHVPAFIDMVGQENNSRQNGFLYMVGQGLSRGKAFVPGLGQSCFYNTKSQITEKVIGRLF